MRTFEFDYRRAKKIGFKALLAYRTMPVRFAGGKKGFAISEYSDTNMQCQSEDFVKLSDKKIIEQIVKIHKNALSKASIFVLDDDKSCRKFRKWHFDLSHSFLWIILGIIIFANPAIFVVAIMLFAITTVFLNTLFKYTILCASLLYKEHPEIAKNIDFNKNNHMFNYPMMTLLIPLHHEAVMVPHLCAQLKKLKYPRDKLEIFFITENKDKQTNAALKCLKMPHYMRVVKLPDAHIKTKPRALNYTLPLTRGEIISIYDSEDNPETDQLIKAAHMFAQSPKDVACLQARLAFYNKKTNWISRCFTLEYSAWFSAILPGLCMLGLPIPLGGTSNFIRRDILLKIGGWDAFNVTEDADLGMRLARFGYKTRILNSTTYEEANCRIWPWIKQRSRWLKGFMMTYLVQMQNPLECFLKHGLSGFIAIQAIFLGSISSALFIPFYLCFWLTSLGFSFPSNLPYLNAQNIHIITIIFLLSEIVTFSLNLLGAKRTGILRFIIWTPTLSLYFTMTFFAVLKAIAEFVFAPFYWDKTKHGIFKHNNADIKTA